MNHQDWDPVTFSKPQAPPKKKIVARDPVRSRNAELSKLDNNEMDSLKHKKSNKNIGKVIQKARLAKGMNQKDLAQALNVKTGVLVEYESGKAIINDNRFLNRCQQILGVYLQGKNIGQPLGDS